LKKRFGQHFIYDRGLLQRIVRFSTVSSSDTVVEIGPGAGTLTRELAAAAQRVIAVEIDRELIPDLRAGMPENVEIIEGDALAMELGSLTTGSFHVVGNLPYNIATALLKRFIAERHRILDVTIMLQREVAERLRAKPNSRDYGPLSVLVQYYASPVWGFAVPPGAFRPQPKVESAVIRLEWKRAVVTNDSFTDFVHRAFGARRKKLVNNLVSIVRSKTREDLSALLLAEEIAPDVRPESLSVEEFFRLYCRLYDNPS